MAAWTQWGRGVDGMGLAWRWVEEGHKRGAAMAYNSTLSEEEKKGKEKKDVS